MSSYLTFYLVPKAEDSKPLDLISYSRNTHIYQYFDETLNVAYIGMGNETQYTELNTQKVDEVLEAMKEGISKYQRQISEYEKHAAGNTDIIEYILELKEELDILEWSLHKVEFIRDIVIEATHSYCDYNKVLCNVD